jgi:hypothetical protein
MYIWDVFGGWDCNLEPFIKGHQIMRLSLPRLSPFRVSGSALPFWNRGKIRNPIVSSIAAGLSWVEKRCLGRMWYGKWWTSCGNICQSFRIFGNYCRESPIHKFALNIRATLAYSLVTDPLLRNATPHSAASCATGCWGGGYLRRSTTNLLEEGEVCSFSAFT